ncbi:hypothetical protein BJ878DRAFT_16415 [Calycina marina]|uniref:Yeast cell wall synthesis Kre9/Knh1-like N-terminal domain-containing protein n=1 Tax=Calycina marina TaxID=1763456 RepID=A0A9P7ZAK7_9HELO|nr:hypothetical protein BJ878DRAFT_16415 [Calycina marina]
MQYSHLPLAVLAFASAVVNAAVFFDAIQTPSEGQVLTAGESFDLVWTPLDVTGTATLQLLHGPTNITLQAGPIVASKISNQLGKYSWTPIDLGFETYGWTITLDADATQIEYSKPFAIKGAAGTTETVQVAQGPSYTSMPSSSYSSMSLLAASSTTAPYVTSMFTTQKTPVSLAEINGTSSTMIAAVTNTPSATTGVESSPGSGSTGAPAAATSSGAAVANIVSGGVAFFGGLIMAFAL